MSLKYLTSDLINSKTHLIEEYHKRLYQTLLRTGTKLILAIIAIALIIFSKGTNWSLWTAAIIFDFILIWTAINFIITAIKVLEVLSCIIVEWSISEGILEYIKAKSISAYFGVGLYSAIRKIGKVITFNVVDLPEPKEIVKDFMSYIIKESLLFILFFYLLIMLVRYGYGNTLMRYYTDMSLFQICCMPIRYLARFIPWL